MCNCGPVRKTDGMASKVEVGLRLPLIVVFFSVPRR